MDGVPFDSFEESFLVSKDGFLISISRVEWDLVGPCRSLEETVVFLLVLLLKCAFSSAICGIIIVELLSALLAFSDNEEIVNIALFSVRMEFGSSIKLSKTNAMLLVELNYLYPIIDYKIEAFQQLARNYISRQKHCLDIAKVIKMCGLRCSGILVGKTLSLPVTNTYTQCHGRIVLDERSM